MERVVINQTNSISHEGEQDHSENSEQDEEHYLDDLWYHLGHLVFGVEASIINEYCGDFNKERNAADACNAISGCHAVEEASSSNNMMPFKQSILRCGVVNPSCLNQVVVGQIASCNSTSVDVLLLNGHHAQFVTHPLESCFTITRDILKYPENIDTNENVVGICGPYL